jgi:hypothetical protein
MTVHAGVRRVTVPAGRLTGRARRRVARAPRREPDDRWAAAFGQIAGYSFAVAAVTGVLLLPFFHPSMATVTYNGDYAVLDGLPVSRAFQSVLAISFDVRGGLLEAEPLADAAPERREAAAGGGKDEQTAWERPRPRRGGGPRSLPPN